VALWQAVAIPHFKPPITYLQYLVLGGKYLHKVLREEEVEINIDAK